MGGITKKRSHVRRKFMEVGTWLSMIVSSEVAEIRALRVLACIRLRPCLVRRFQVVNAAAVSLNRRRNLRKR